MLRLPKMKCPVITLYRLNLPKGFFYEVTVAENGAISGGYSVTIGYLGGNLKTQFVRNSDNRMRIFEFLCEK